MNVTYIILFTDAWRTSDYCRYSKMITSAMQVAQQCLKFDIRMSRNVLDATCMALLASVMTASWYAICIIHRIICYIKVILFIIHLYPVFLPLWTQGIADQTPSFSLSQLKLPFLPQGCQIMCPQGHFPGPFPCKGNGAEMGAWQHRSNCSAAGTSGILTSLGEGVCTGLWHGPGTLQSPLQASPWG